MKRASMESLQAAGLLEALRAMDLNEPSPGAFYKGRTPVVHFHEEAGVVYADIKLGAEWRRLSVSSESNRKQLLKTIGDLLT